jgi:1,4-dihydroxy-6-naphthoate synthase
MGDEQMTQSQERVPAQQPGPTTGQDARDGQGARAGHTDPAPAPQDRRDGQDTGSRQETLRIAYSPCPNDTFVFHAWAHGLVEGAPPLDVSFADIDITNGMAERGEFDVLKVSYAVLPWVLEEYALLPCGGALGRGCGPLVLTKEPGTDLSGKTVAVPSERSTAYLLFRLWAAAEVNGGVGEIVVLPFHEIMPAVRDGRVDAGLVIHEARFTYQNYGLHKLADMGEHWEATTGLPIPLGAIIAKRSLGTARLRALAEAARASVRQAWKEPELSREYVLAHSQEMDPAVADQHIALYVNEFSADLGEDGYAAVRGLLTRAAAEGLVPPLPAAALTF